MKYYGNNGQERRNIWRENEICVIEETFPLKCSMAEFTQFIQDSKKHARGWIGFYWGQPPDELRLSNQIGDMMTLGWLEFFQAKGKPAQEKPAK